MSSSPLAVSVVVPIYNGATTIGPLVERLIAHYQEQWELEIILVNDASLDESRSVCEGLVERFPGIVRFLHMSRNFGEHNAVMAGLRRTRGAAAVIMDDDFQNPPEEVGKLVEALVAGDFDVVYSRYDTKHHSLFRNLGSRFNDRVAQFMLKKPRGLYLSSFKCMNRFLIDQVGLYSGPFPYVDGLILRVTRNYGVVTCEHAPRDQGESGYTLRKLVSLWLNMFTGSSIAPLRAATIAGVSFSVLGGLMLIGVFLEKYLEPDTQVGWASLATLILVFSGIQLVVLGLIGEYLGRLFLSENKVPQAVVRSAMGWEVPTAEGVTENAPADSEPSP